MRGARCVVSPHPGDNARRGTVFLNTTRYLASVTSRKRRDRRYTDNVARTSAQVLNQFAGRVANRKSNGGETFSGQEMSAHRGCDFVRRVVRWNAEDAGLLKLTSRH